MPEITVIVPTWKREAIFKETITALQEAIKNIDAEVIVINDDVQTEIEIDNPKVRVVRNIGRGVTVARNYGARIAAAPLILFMDNDVVVAEENILKTIKIHKEQKNILVNANWVYPQNILNQIDKSQFGRVLTFWKLNSFKDRYEAFNGKWHTEIFDAVHPFAAYYFSIEKVNYLNTTGFDETIIVGGEEAAFGKQLTALGIKYIIDPSNIVCHNEKDRVDNYKEWLKRVRQMYEKTKLQNTNAQELKKTKSNRIFKILSFLERPLYFFLDKMPNKKGYDKMYARALSLLKNIIMNK